MFPKMVRASKGLWREVQDITRRGRDVWRLVPSGQKRALVGASLVMAASAKASTAIPVILKDLFDKLEYGRDKVGVDRSALIQLSLASARADRLGLPGPRDHERPASLSGGERLHADRQGSLRPVGLAPDGGRPRYALLRAGGSAPRADPPERRGVCPLPADQLPRLLPGHLHRLLRPANRLLAAAEDRAGDGLRRAESRSA